MLDKLIGAQIVNINEDSIEVKLNDTVYKLEIDSEDGDCCGYAHFETKMLYSENDFRNPIITNVQLENDEEGYDSDTSVLTFYGEDKELAIIESSAGSGSGWNYGSYVSIRCKLLDIDEGLASW